MPPCQYLLNGRKVVFWPCYGSAEDAFRKMEAAAAELQSGMPLEPENWLNDHYMAVISIFGTNGRSGGACLRLITWAKTGEVLGPEVPNWNGPVIEPWVLRKALEDRSP